MSIINTTAYKVSNAIWSMKGYFTIDEVCSIIDIQKEAILDSVRIVLKDMVSKNILETTGNLYYFTNLYK